MSHTTNSDSEDDLDYVPPEDDHDSDSSDDQAQVENITESSLLVTDPVEQKKQRDALWASFQASVSTPSNGNVESPLNQRAVNWVKIEKTYLFAGKHVTDVVEVQEDSEEAKKWPRWSPHACPSSASAPLSAYSSEKEEEPREKSATTPSPAVDSNPAMPSPMIPPPGLKRLAPRKPRTALPSIPKASQAKKITTLDKSAMDWRAHIASQPGDIKDELDANRRGGGYLEKVDFLKRVEDRREETFEANKSSKRRKT